MSRHTANVSWEQKLRLELDEAQQLITRLTEALAALVNADAGGETTPDFERAIVNARIVLAAVAKEHAK